MSKDGSVRTGTRGHKGNDRTTPKQPDLSVVSMKDVDASLYPKPDAFLGGKQHDGIALCGREVYYKLMKWLHSAGLTSVQPKLVEEYALSYARWRQAEKLISRQGFLAPHPTTGADIASPLVGIAAGYFKQMHAAWYAIWDVVKIAAQPVVEYDDMETLLSEVE